ncbi:hypothetical protein L9F63_003784, partial [Diploptera punctata]
WRQIQKKTLIRKPPKMLQNMTNQTTDFVRFRNTLFTARLRKLIPQHDKINLRHMHYSSTAYE